MPGSRPSGNEVQGVETPGAWKPNLGRILALEPVSLSQPRGAQAGGGRAWHRGAAGFVCYTPVSNENPAGVPPAGPLSSPISRGGKFLMLVLNENLAPECGQPRGPGSHVLLAGRLGKIDGF